MWAIHVSGTEPVSLGFYIRINNSARLSLMGAIIEMPANIYFYSGPDLRVELARLSGFVNLRYNLLVVIISGGGLSKFSNELA